MQLRQLLNPQEHAALRTVGDHVSSFIEGANGLPLFKNLPEHYSDVHRVKVRKRKHSSEFVETFNEAFDDQFGYLRQRAVFASGVLEEALDGYEPFYVFPVNGFKYLYSKEVANSSHEFRTVYESIFDNLSSDAAEQTFQDLLKFTYCSERLDEGIEHGAEIIIYNTPAYYAVRQSAFPDYDELLSLIQGS
jgi:hypothetical protein